METLPNGLPVAGQRLRLEITDLAFGGEGVGRVGEFVVFIPFTAPGDVVEAKLTEVKNRSARVVESHAAICNSPTISHIDQPTT
ncbi:MAG: TRAM domain-containing protein [Proteobacteria bacterium]|nr:TRAM domain-containing protein [Pseudomonadota bacterium]